MLTRREFTRLAVAGAASQVVSPLLAQGSDGKIGYCIIGLGRISMDHFMPGALASKNSKSSLSTTATTVSNDEDVISLHSAQEGTVQYRIKVVPKAA